MRANAAWLGCRLSDELSVVSESSPLLSSGALIDVVVVASPIDYDDGGCGLATTKTPYCHVAACHVSLARCAQQQQQHSVFTLV